MNVLSDQSDRTNEGLPVQTSGNYVRCSGCAASVQPARRNNLIG